MLCVVSTRVVLPCASGTNCPLGIQNSDAHLCQHYHIPMATISTLPYGTALVE